MKIGFPASLSARITIGFVILVVAFGAISLRTVKATEELHQAIRIIHGGHLQLALVSSDMHSRQSGLRSYLREELQEENSLVWAQKRLQRFLDARAGLLQAAESILGDAKANALEMDGADNKQFDTTSDLLGRIRLLVDQSEEAYQILLASPPIAGSPVADSVAKALKRQQRVELQLAQLTDELKKWEAIRVVALSDRLEEESRKAWIYTLVFSVVAIVLGLLMAYGATIMLRPLQRLREAAGRIASGEYSHRIPVGGPREIADLANEFNVMGEAIAAHSRELVQAERLATAGKMAAMITHEVRNPLSSIGLNTELLQEELGLLPPDRMQESQELCRSIITEVDRLTDITEEYLQLTRLPNPKLQEESLGRVVRSVVSFIRDPMRSKGVQIEVDIEESPPFPLDEGQIRQALLNLIRNAAEAVEGREDGLVTIEVRPVGTNTELVISDNGTGIPEDIMEHIFEAFVSSKSSGTGLGLALTQQIISDHGGSIAVSNAASGGAVFRILFAHTAHTGAAL